jgi:hypothetical protein
MYNANRRSLKFIRGVHDFLNVAKTNMRNGFCPCVLGKNEKNYASSRTVHEHQSCNVKNDAWTFSPFRASTFHTAGALIYLGGKDQ